MHIQANNVETKKIGSMILKPYPINSDYSAALINIDGDHGRVKCIREDRLYYIIEGSGNFIVDDKTYEVNKDDVVFVPKETIYNFIGKMKIFLVNSPAFNPNDDVYFD